MNHEELKKIGEWLNTNGYCIDLTDDFWMEEYVWGDHKTRDICQMLFEYHSEQCNIDNVGISLPERNSVEMWNFLLVNALRCLTEEQRAGLCFDLYCRNELTESIDERICKLKDDRQ